MLKNFSNGPLVSRMEVFTLYMIWIRPPRFVINSSYYQLACRTSINYGFTVRSLCNEILEECKPYTRKWLTRTWVRQSSPDINWSMIKMTMIRYTGKQQRQIIESSDSVFWDRTINQHATLCNRGIFWNYLLKCANCKFYKWTLTAAVLILNE